MNILLRPFARYAVFSGRARRSEYWLFLLLQIFVYMGCGFVFGLCIQTAPFTSFLALAMGGIFSLATLIPNLAVMVRRLHDTGRSAWVLLVYVPFLANLYMVLYDINWLHQHGIYDLSQAFQHPVLGFTSLIARIYLLRLMRKDGDFGPNRYGPDPKQEQDADKSGGGDNGYTPVFDFGPSSAPAEAMELPAERPAVQTYPVPSARQVQAQPAFGKRNRS